MFPEEDEERSSDIIDYVREEFLGHVDAEIFIAADDFDNFKEELDVSLLAMQKWWKHIQQGKQKLEPSFIYSDADQLPWTVFHLPSTDGEQANSLFTAAGTEDDVVILPRVYHMETGRATPIIPGAVLQRSQLMSGADEARRNSPITSFAQSAPSRHRNRTSRTMSIKGSSPRNVRNEGRFLS